LCAIIDALPVCNAFDRWLALVCCPRVTVSDFIFVTLLLCYCFDAVTGITSHPVTEYCTAIYSRSIQMFAVSGLCHEKIREFYENIYYQLL